MINKIYTKTILIIAIMFMLPFTATAAYSNDFSSGTMSGFTLVGSWSAASGYATTTLSGTFLSDTYNSATVITTQPINKYWSVVMNGTFTCSCVGPMTAPQGFIYEGNATDFKSMNITYTAPSGAKSFSVFGEGAYIAVDVTNRGTIRAELIDSGSNMVVNLYNNTNGTLFDTQTIGKTAYITTDRIALVSGVKPVASSATRTFISGYDNIIISEAPPSSSTGISWLLPSYTVGDSPSFSWSITDADWNGHPLQIYVVRLYKSGIMQDFGSFNFACLCSTQLAVAQSGSYVVTADEPGTYLVTLELMYPLVGGNVVVSQSTTSVHAQSSSYFTIPAQANENTNVSATYHLGTGGMTGVLQTFSIDENGIEQFEKSFYTIGLDGSINITFHKVARYNVKLYNYNDGTLLQTKSITISFVPSIPVGNFALSTINTTASTYYRHDIMSGHYIIDAVNYTHGTPYISIYNYGIGAETARFYNQNGLTGLVAGNDIGSLDYGTFDYYVSDTVGQVPNIIWLAGNNSIRLMMQNSVTNNLTVLAYSNFTLIDLDATGYGLTVVPTTVNINENVRITTTCPADCILSVQRPNGATSYFNVSSGTRTIFQAYPTSGKYGIALMDSGSHIHQTVIVTVSTTVSPGITPSTGISTSTALSLINVFGIIAFWGFVIWLGIVGSVVIKMSNSASGINGTALIAIAWFSAVFIAIIGLFDPFKIYIIVISTIIAAVYFKFGRSTTVED